MFLIAFNRKNFSIKKNFNAEKLAFTRLYDIMKDKF